MSLFSCGGEKPSPSADKTKSNKSSARPASVNSGKTPAAEPKSPEADAKPISASPAVGAGSGGWTAFRGSATRTGQADVRGPRTNELKWVFRTEGRIYADAAVTPDGRTVYVASHDQHLYALNPDGTRRWAYDTGGKIWTSPAIAEDGTVYVGTDNDMLIALHPDGRKRWGFVTTEPPVDRKDQPEAGRYDVDTSPLILPDGSIVFGCNLKLIALRPVTGDLRWVFVSGKGRSRIFSSPALDSTGNIYFGTQGSWFFSLNESAQVQWSVETGDDNDATPVVGPDGAVYFASDDGIVRSYTASGKERWTTRIGRPIRAPLALGRTGVLLVATYGRSPELVALNAPDGVEKWRFAIAAGEGDFYGIQSGAVVDADGYIYFGGRDHRVYCLDPAGSPVWSYETGDQVDAGPALGPDGTLYIGSDDHRLYAFGAAARVETPAFQ